MNSNSRVGDSGSGVGQGRLPTQDRLQKWYPEKKLVFPLCGTCPDFLNHLFFECNYSIKVWREWKKASNQTSLLDRWDDIIMNKRLFTSNRKGSNELIDEVFKHLRLKMASLTVKRTVQVEKVSKKWKVEMNAKKGYGYLMEAMSIEDH
ncbi:reverse transcriptase zinc-binding domain-containing protein [Tanacetum coccineum]